MRTKFISKPKSYVTAYKTWDTVLKCDIFGFPSPVITWTRSLKQLPINRHVINGNQLTIKNSTDSDGGAYVCQGANPMGNVMAVIWIFVKDVGKLTTKLTLSQTTTTATRTVTTLITTKTTTAFVVTLTIVVILLIYFLQSIPTLCSVLLVKFRCRMLVIL